MRRPWALLVFPLLLVGLGDCSKARGDEFSRFRPEEKLLAEGAAPRQALRYRPLPGRDLVYQLTATRRTDNNRPRSRMRLRVALTFPPEGQSTTFALRLLTVLRLEPEPPAGAADLGPTHLLLGGALGPRGALERLEASEELPSPINLSLLAPLLLPTYPEASVGIGGKWHSSRRFSWSHKVAPDRLLGRLGSFDGRSEVLLDRHFTLAREDPQGDAPLLHLEGTAQARLRSRTVTLSHATRHEGTAQASLAIAVDKATCLPESAKITLKGTYTLEAAGKKRKAEETIEVTLTRER